MERFNLKKLNEVGGNEQYRVEVSQIGLQQLWQMLTLRCKLSVTGK
jgi:hypothetical protein